MRESVARDMAWGNAAMAEHWPRVAHLVGGGVLVSNENATSGSSNQLDMESGVDWFIKQTRNGVPGNIPIAARVQDASRVAWASHTVRTKRHGSPTVTELQRRQAERDMPGSATPHYAFQLYVNKPQNWRPGETTGVFVLGGVAKEADLLAMIDARRYTTRLNTQEGNRPVDFAAVWWSDLIAEGFEVRYACGDGVSLVAGQKRAPTVVQKRKPCCGCGYFYCISGEHRADCTAIQVSEIEATAVIATVFKEG